jgi:uncharacterized protein (TIGR00369 family)
MSDSQTPIEAPEATAGQLAYIRQQIHPHCVVCGSDNLAGLRLNFVTLPDGSVQADFACRRLFEGYPNTLHGGVICSLLDGAMTNCLFAQGRTAVTAKMNVRFKRPVVTERAATVRAWVTASCHSLYYVAADLRQDGEVMTTATATFMEQAGHY